MPIHSATAAEKRRRRSNRSARGEEYETFAAVRGGVAQTRIERFDVAVDVGEKGDEHRTIAILNVGVALAIMSGSCPWVQGDKYE